MLVINVLSVVDNRKLRRFLMKFVAFYSFGVTTSADWAVRFFELKSSLFIMDFLMECGTTGLFILYLHYGASSGMLQTLEIMMMKSIH